MTPRESLEAAGWTPANNYAIWWHVNSNGWITQAEALAQLARDEAKETSDGQDGCSSTRLDGGDRNSPLDTVVPDKAAPVATSVSAPDDLDRVATWLDLPEHQISLPEHKHVNDCGGHTPFTAGSCLRCAVEIAMAAYAREYASSSSAALLAANEVIRRQLKKVCDQVGAAEAKVTELEAQVKQFGKVLVAGHAILDSAGIPDKNVRPVNHECDSMLVERLALLRDSRDRLQKEFDVMRLRALSAEKIARIPIRTQDEEFIASALAGIFPAVPVPPTAVAPPSPVDTELEKK